MFEQETTLFALNLAFIQRLAADIPDDAASRVSLPLNPPHWLLGHLCVSADFITQVAGGASLLPEGWFAQFGPGSPGRPTLCPMPPVQDLLAKLAEFHELAAAAVRRADPAKLAAPHNLPFFPPPSPIRTWRDLIAHVMTTHEAFHAGQLSTWRRALGLPPLL